MAFLSPIAAQSANIFSGVSGIIGGVGQLQQAQQTEELGDRNARILEQRAKSEREGQALLEGQKRRLIRSRIGTQVAAVAGRGIKLSGSPLDVMVDSLTNAELDISIDKYNSEVTARGFESQAGMTRFEARQASAKKRFKAGRTFLSTGLSFLKSQREIGGVK